MQIPGNDTTLIPAQNANALLYAPFPAQEGSFVWVFDATGQPVENATIKYSNTNSKGETVRSVGNGIYPMPVLKPGDYIILVTAPGYETHRHAVTIFENIPLREKAVLGKPGDLYMFGPWGAIPFAPASELVSFQHKQPFHVNDDAQRVQDKHSELMKAIEQLAAIAGTQAQTNGGQTVIAWPTGPGKRKDFLKAIEESAVLGTDKLYISDGYSEASGISDYIVFQVSQQASEQVVRETLEKFHFEIKEWQTINVNNAPVRWQAGAVYRLPLSFDFLRDIQHINNSLPVLNMQLTYTIPAKPTRTR